MSNCNSLPCLAVHSLVTKWMAAHQPAVAWSVFEDGKTKDISIHVMLSGHPQRKLLKGQQTSNISDSGITTDVKDWLANLPYPQTAAGTK